MLPHLSFFASTFSFSAPRLVPILHSGRLLREHGRMVVSMPAGAPHPFLLETGGVLRLEAGTIFALCSPAPAASRTRRILSVCGGVHDSKENLWL